MSEHDFLNVESARGDPRAWARLRQRLRRGLVRIVRRTLRGCSSRNASMTPLARRILAEARHGSPGDFRPGAGQEEMIGRLAGRLCERVIDRLRGGAGSLGQGGDATRRHGAELTPCLSSGAGPGAGGAGCPDRGAR